MHATTTTATGSLAIVVPASDPAWDFIKPRDTTGDPEPFYLELIAELGDPGTFRANGAAVLVGEVVA